MKIHRVLPLFILATACGKNNDFSGGVSKTAPAVPAETPVVETPQPDPVSTSTDPEETSITAETPVETPVIDNTVAFAKLNGARWDMPCIGAPAGTGCQTNSPINQTVEMEGDVTKQYIVTLRIRGVVEPMLYKDGTQSTVDPHFYVGGSSNNPFYNIYRLTIENPAQDYFLNRSDAVSATTFVIDYTIDVTIGGKSKVTLFADAQNGSSIANIAALTVPGLTTPAELLTGQFVQMDVVSVKVKE